MEATTRVVRLEVSLAGESLTGWARDDLGATRRFDGRLGLLAAVDTLTVIGTVVNTAARAQAAAEGGGVLVTRSVYERAARTTVGGTGRDYRLKGYDTPVHLFAV